MWLLKRDDDSNIALAGPFEPGTIPPYAILSHTWGREECTFQDLSNGTGKDKEGFDKIKLCVEQAEKMGLGYSWVDTCCIDKTNSVELNTAINSMFRWYQNSERCFAYLSDVNTISDAAAFRASRWFTRGWTLQELIAPRSVEFFTKDWLRIGSKRDKEEIIRSITGIPLAALRGDSLVRFGILERLSWMHGRQTLRPEDQAYSLFGILGVTLPVIYGESKEAAMDRLIEEARRVDRQRQRTQARSLDWRTGPGPERLVPHKGISEAAPALAESQGDLVAVWRGRDESFGFLVPLPYMEHITGSLNLWWTRMSSNGSVRLTAGPVRLLHTNALSRERPAVAALADQLVAAWRAVDDNALYFSTLSNNSEEWTNPRPIPDGWSTASPVLARWEWGGSSRVYALWKGAINSNVYLSWYDGENWQARARQLDGFLQTDTLPGLTCRRNELFVAWKAASTEKLYWMRLDSEGTALLVEPHEMCWHGESSLGPALAELDGTIYAAYKAKREFTDTWLAAWSVESERFAPAEMIPNSNTEAAPSLARMGNSLVLAWRGTDKEKTMWWRVGRRPRHTGV